MLLSYEVQMWKNLVPCIKNTKLGKKYLVIVELFFQCQVVFTFGYFRNTLPKWHIFGSLASIFKVKSTLSRCQSTNVSPGLGIWYLGHPKKDYSDGFNAGVLLLTPYIIDFCENDKAHLP